jgi:protein O-GlcNAc transferase
MATPLMKIPSRPLTHIEAGLSTLQSAVRAQDWLLAVAQGEALTQQAPHQGLGWALLGEAWMGRGNFNNAAKAFENAARLMPSHPGVWLNWGSCFEQTGQTTQALDCYTRALQLNPQLASAHYNMGTLNERLGEARDAMTSYEACVQHDPSFAPAYFNAARLYQHWGEIPKAMTLCDQAISLAPNLLEARALKARLFLQMNRPAEALALLEQVQQNGLRGVLLDINLGQAYLRLHRSAEALVHLQAALSQEPANDFALSELALTLQSMGRIAEARQAYDALTYTGNTGLLVRRALLLSPIMGTLADVRAERQQFETQVEHLIESGVQLIDAATEVGQTAFFLHYQGLNDRQAMSRLADFYLAACPSLAYVAPHIDSGEPYRAKPRVGFFCQTFVPHVVTIYFGHIINSLACRNTLEVWLISGNDINQEVYNSFDGRTLKVPHELPAARELIATLGLDILIYLDIGTEPVGTFLAYSRLARVQCALVGMPVTTGIPAIDWFVSSTLVEPSDAADHYSERLLLLSRVLFYFTKPTLPSKFRDRNMLGLPIAVPIYVVPVKLHKIHPDFDALLDQILLQDPTAIALFFKDDADPDWRFQFGRRLDKTLSPGPRKQIRFAQWLSEEDLIQVVRNSDVVLDPLHFGMGATGRLIFAVGTPVVTLRGQYMRARVCASMCDLLGLGDCVATSGDDYIQKALHFARDGAARQSVFDRMHGNAAALYEVDAIVPEFEQALLALAQGLHPGITAAPAPIPAHRSSPTPG